ncbi:ABC transporter ATP-binding protein [Corynebacterium canis]|uniref:ABC transporter ATP-binding protein n=1 Tax=Corynebacterium canis TaxID=679663 RepID=A0A5C5UT84_9CORY|nr:ABC transporter ATP-binding protein [Corynebacterium canis]WJY75265.1 Macrolide export ATP-binding/permease protein MacB [Corynebacterium canis]
MLYSLKNVTKTYGEPPAEVRALDDVSVDIPAGKFIVVLGASGSGKSTLLNMLGGMDTPTSGTLLFNGTDISNYSAKQLTKFRKNEVGFVFQSYNLLSDLTAKENVEFSTEIAGIPREYATEALEKVGLGDRLDHYPAQLSGGQQQRVSIARGLAKKPAVLLCDEPTGALDFQTGIKVLEVLHQLHRENNTSIIVITHNQDIANIADLVLTMRSGKIIDIESNANPLSPAEVKW